MVFFVGDIRRLHSFPWVTWSVHAHEIDYDEVLETLPLIEYGDVGIHRDNGYLSNLAIPGFMKHAWIHVSDGMQKPHIIEAISEGVIKRNAIYPLFSDFTIILRPKNVSEKERKGACKKAQGVIGEKYDVHFDFNIEEELTHFNKINNLDNKRTIKIQNDLRYYTGTHKDEALNDMKEAQENLQKFDGAFSCTELVSYAWWHKREELRLFRKQSRGKSVILADDFLNGAWEIIWASASVNIENAHKFGLHEEGLEMIRSYLDKNSLN